jgi:hypothetical protein
VAYSRPATKQSVPSVKSVDKQSVKSVTSVDKEEKQMLGRPFVVSFVLTGAPGESKAYYFTAPCDMTLFHVSLCNISGGTGTLDITDDGTEITDDDAIGEGSTPTVMNQDDMSGDQYPRIAAGSVVGFHLTDTDTDDVMVVATFLF